MAETVAGSVWIYSASGLVQFDSVFVSSEAGKEAGWLTKAFLT